MKDLIVKLLKFIFSITDKTDHRRNHYQLCILGLKWKFIKPAIAKRRREMPFDSYKKIMLI